MKLKPFVNLFLIVLVILLAFDAITVQAAPVALSASTAAYAETPIEIPWGTIVVVGLLAGFVASLFIAYRAGGISAVNRQLVTIKADTVSLDRTEDELHKQFTQRQLDYFQQVLFPIFALGLAITPDGPLDEAIANFQALVTTVTDGKPNVPPTPPAPTTDTSEFNWT